MKTKILLLISTLFFSINTFSQQIGDGFSLNINDFTIPLKSGIYNGLTPVGATPDNSNPWQHLFIIRHLDRNNNHQLQIASSTANNDRIFFRKIASATLNSQNPTWIELATRSKNNFEGDQNINGTLNIGTLQSTSPLSIGSNHGIKLSIGNTTWINKSIIQTGYNTQIGDYTEINVPGHAINNASIRIARSGNVGIGTTNPTAKLTVAGDINSREVRVTVDAGADFVFGNDYNLPSLTSVETFIKENKHLPEIASAKEMQENGINLSEMNIKLLQKIEELTLYMIELKKANEKQNNQIQLQNDKIFSLEKKIDNKNTID